MNSRQRTKKVKGIVIHSMGEVVDGKYATEFLEQIGLSAHYFITPDGDIVYNVPHTEIAYHAGLSKWKDWSGLNQNFLGIELLVKGNHNYQSFAKAIKDSETFSEEMYKATATLCDNLMSIYQDITKENIVAHSTVSGPEVRHDPKIDPGEGFDMQKLKDMI